MRPSSRRMLAHSGMLLYNATPQNISFRPPTAFSRAVRRHFPSLRHLAVVRPSSRQLFRSERTSSTQSPFFTPRTPDCLSLHALRSPAIRAPPPIGGGGAFHCPSTYKQHIFSFILNRDNLPKVRFLARRSYILTVPWGSKRRRGSGGTRRARDLGGSTAAPGTTEAGSTVRDAGLGGPSG